MLDHAVMSNDTCCM